MAAGCGGAGEMGEAPRIARKVHPPLRAAPTTKPECQFTDLAREELHIDSDTPGISLFMFRVRSFGKRRGAVLLLHGAGSPASALWDIDVEDYSVMRRLACAGFDAYAVDVRGFGGSTWPPPLLAPAEGQPPAVRAADVMPDVAAAVCGTPATVRSGFDRDRPRGLVLGMCSGGHGRRAATPSRFGGWCCSPPFTTANGPRGTKRPALGEPRTRALYFKYHRPPARRALEVLQRLTWPRSFGSWAPTQAPVRLPNGPYRDLYGPDSPVWDAEKP